MRYSQKAMLKTHKALLLGLTFATGLWAQMTTSSMLGTVKDATGAAMSDANIKIRNLAQTMRVKWLLRPKAASALPLLPPGSYEVTVTAKGFGKYVQGPIVLRLGQDAELDLKLEVASVTETITVTGDATLLNTTNAEVGH